MEIAFRDGTYTRELDEFLLSVGTAQPGHIEMAIVYPYQELEDFMPVIDKRWIRLLGEQIDLSALLYTAYPVNIEHLRAEVNAHGHVVVTLLIKLPNP